MADLHIGTSGWVYKHWVGRFYPDDLSAHSFLPFYAEQFDTAEINYSFYKLPSPENYDEWRRQVNADFVFAVKASRYLTHMKKLKDPADPWQKIKDTAGHLKEKLGPVLLQFPAQWGKNLERLDSFLAMTKDGKDDDSRIRLAFEFRDESWFSSDVYKLLEKYNAALCIADSLKFIRKDIVTANFTYIRYHGRTPIYAANYSKRQLESESKKIRQYLADDTDVFAYFNNDGLGHAIKNAEHLKQMLK